MRPETERNVGTSEDLKLERRVASCLLFGVDAPRAEHRPTLDIRGQVMGLEQLPPMPGMAVRILRLAQDPESRTEELVELIKSDPDMAAQVVRIANSPLYTPGGGINCVERAVPRLGFNMILRLAFALAAIEPFRVPLYGPLGLREFWRHALLTGGLCQKLATKVGSTPRPVGPVAYLCGLLHNLGLLVLAHVFPDAHRLATDLRKANSELSLQAITSYALGVDTVQLGLWLMDAWAMPGEVQISIREQDNPEYRGEEHAYPNLALIANALLHSKGIGFGESDQVPADLLADLDLTDADTGDALDHIIGQLEHIDGVVSVLLGSTAEARH